MTALGPQFLYHGTAQHIEGDKILPSSVHGGHSYWGDAGTNKGQPSKDHAWAHPDEHKTWEFALDRANFHLMDWESADDHPIAPRARVFALHPNENMTPGKDLPGEIKSTHFDIAHPLDTMPGRQGTFPEINWNEHVKTNEYLPGDEDANHPSNLSAQFGHNQGVWGTTGAHNRLHQAAQAEDTNRYLDRLDVVGGARGFDKDTMLPGMSSDDRKYMRRR